MYQGFCLGMFLVNSLLSNAKYITMRNEQKNIYTNIGGDAAAAVGVAGADDGGDNGAWEWIIFGLLEVVFTKDFAKAT